jgi:hypothetical protein
MSDQKYRTIWVALAYTSVKKKLYAGVNISALVLIYQHCCLYIMLCPSGFFSMKDKQVGRK